MNLSSRLSTAVRCVYIAKVTVKLIPYQANNGQLDDVRTRHPLMLGNISALQVQALAMAVIAALGTFALGKLIPPLPDDHIPPIANSTRLPFHAPRELHLLHALHDLSPRALTKLTPGKTRSGFREYESCVWFRYTDTYVYYAIGFLRF